MRRPRHLPDRRSWSDRGKWVAKKAPDEVDKSWRCFQSNFSRGRRRQTDSMFRKTTWIFYALILIARLPHSLQVQQSRSFLPCSVSGVQPQVGISNLQYCTIWDRLGICPELSSRKVEAHGRQETEYHAVCNVILYVKGTGIMVKNVGSAS